MTARDENRSWLHQGALDLVALQEGSVFNVDLRHRPFAGNEPLKEIVREAQEAVSRVQRVAYEIWWQAGEERRARRDLTE